MPNSDQTGYRQISGIEAVDDLATLAPEVLNAIAKGEQPEGITSDYLIKTGFPAIWSEQRQQFASL